MPAEPRTVAAIAVGGSFGALARWGVATALPHTEGAFAWSTFLINTLGCLLMGVLMGVLTTRAHHPLARPFLGIGFLGGFTTFSTYIVDAQHTDPLPAAAYLVATPLAAIFAVWAGHRMAAR